MKIAFLVGSIKTKTNGVAAYTKLLSEHLEANGHMVTIITLNEEKPEEEYANNYFIAKELSILNRFSKLDSTLKKLNPDLISIQFVPYSFHKKGLTLELLLFTKILKKFQVHLMVHEPWIEITKQTNLQNRIVSILQNALLFGIIKHIKPVLITSTIPHFVKKIGRSTKLLPLASNIPFQPKPNLNVGSVKELKCIFFGNFSFDTNGFKSQLNWIKQYCFENNLIPRITLVGDNGIQKVEHVLLIKNVFGEGSLLDLGWLNEKDISYLLQEQDLGISRATLSLFGKSGSTMAMLEHGLPVLLRGLEEASVDTLSNTGFAKQLIQISEGFNYKMCRFEPKIDAANAHSLKFISYINESLLPS